MSTTKWICNTTVCCIYTVFEFFTTVFQACSEGIDDPLLAVEKGLYPLWFDVLVLKSQRHGGAQTFERVTTKLPSTPHQYSSIKFSPTHFDSRYSLSRYLLAALRRRQPVHPRVGSSEMTGVNLDPGLAFKSREPRLAASAYCIYTGRIACPTPASR